MSTRLGDSTFWLNMDQYTDFIAATLDGLQPGDVFIDVGANMGIFALAAAQRVGPTGLVLAFEPSLREFHELVRNVQLNQASNVMPFRLALDEADAIGELFMADEIMSGLNSRAPSDGGKGQKETILAMRFDSLGFEKLIAAERRVFVKIDTEGCELRALTGMREFLETHNVERIVAELDDVLLGRLGGSMEQVSNMLQSLGFVGTAASRSSHYDEVYIRKGRQRAATLAVV
jgi:FkbM family methyltransferase